MNRKILFLTWDSDKTQYLEGLFLPIFKALSEQTGLQIHIIQCSWADAKKVRYLQAYCSSQNITYRHISVQRTPHPLIGTFLTVHQAGKTVLAYCKEQKIDFLMPRSTMPNWIVNRIYGKLPSKLKIIMDADGLPIEERVDFAGLKKGSFLYRFLKGIEKKGLTHADAVICRSHKAIDFLCEQHQITNKSKFHKVVNGRDVDLFVPSNQVRQKVRDELKMGEGEKLLIYAGSLGPQYGIQEMLDLIEMYSRNNPLKALFLTGNPEFLTNRIPVDMQELIQVKQVAPAEVPAYLNAADLAFAIREPKLSMIGVAPIKLGEYVLMGLPTIASKGIGDTEELLADVQGCHLFDHHDPDRLEKALKFMQMEHKDIQQLRNLGQEHFSLEASVLTYRKALEGLC